MTITIIISITITITITIYIYYSYGNLDDHETLGRYGFIESNNPNHKIKLEINEKGCGQGLSLITNRISKLKLNPTLPSRLNLMEQCGLGRHWFDTVGEISISIDGKFCLNIKI